MKLAFSLVAAVSLASISHAAEVEWTGVLDTPFQDLPAGYEMRAYIGMFFTFRDGKIVSQRNYDCYPPFD